MAAPDGGGDVSQELVDALVDKCMAFMDHLTGVPLHPYQVEPSRRIIESVILNDGELITVLASRQSGKTQLISHTVSTLMIVLPLIAPLYPDLLGKFSGGFWVGIFAPVENQSETLYGRVHGIMTSERAKSVLADPEINDSLARVGKATRGVRLERSGSSVTMMTANPRAKIESKSFHLIIVDEAQHCSEQVLGKSVGPMGAYWNATQVYTGTSTMEKNIFHRSIQRNKRKQAMRGSRRNHFEWDWKIPAKYNPNYKKFIEKEMLRLGEDSSEFQLSYLCRWLFESGMFTTQATLEELSDTTADIVKQYYRTPCVAGVDPARKNDSTVVTVLWVDWDRPDEYGYYDHRVLNWLEIVGDDWETQYFKIVAFLSNYDILACGVDSAGVGDAVAQRLAILMPRTQVVAVTSSQGDQSRRFKHLRALMERRMIHWPAHPHARKLRSWKRFMGQMGDAELEFKGPYLSVRAPKEANAFDDYVDSLGIAAAMTLDLTMPNVQVEQNPFYRGRVRALDPSRH